MFFYVLFFIIMSENTLKMAIDVSLLFISIWAKNKNLQNNDNEI